MRLVTRVSPICKKKEPQCGPRPWVSVPTNPSRLPCILLGAESRPHCQATVTVMRQPVLVVVPRLFAVDVSYRQPSSLPKLAVELAARVVGTALLLLSD
ncbi:glycyl-tRNA synthetase, alpha subunit [Bradyrhizobium elkanii USDA 61]|nr:glycyl-tRNA synthetase, alpha subunit [Bradyrhizobium elkanii USDA 61]